MKIFIDIFQLRGNYEVASFLVSQKSVDINSQDSNGNSALHFGCMQSQRKIVELLLGQKNIQSSLRNNEDKMAKDLSSDSKIIQLFNKLRKVNLDLSYGSVLTTLNVTLNNISSKEGQSRESPHHEPRSRQSGFTGGFSNGAIHSNTALINLNTVQRSFSNSSQSQSYIHNSSTSKQNKSTTKNTYLTLKHALSSQKNSNDSQQNQSKALQLSSPIQKQECSPLNLSSQKSINICQQAQTTELIQKGLNTQLIDSSMCANRSSSNSNQIIGESTPVNMNIETNSSRNGNWFGKNNSLLQTLSPTNNSKNIPNGQYQQVNMVNISDVRSNQPSRMQSAQYQELNYKSTSLTNIQNLNSPTNISLNVGSQKQFFHQSSERNIETPNTDMKWIQYNVNPLPINQIIQNVNISEIQSQNDCDSPIQVSSTPTNFPLQKQKKSMIQQQKIQLELQLAQTQSNQLPFSSPKITDQINRILDSKHRSRSQNNNSCKSLKQLSGNNCSKISTFGLNSGIQAIVSSSKLDKTHEEKFSSDSNESTSNSHQNSSLAFAKLSTSVNQKPVFFNSSSSIPTSMSQSKYKLSKQDNYQQNSKFDSIQPNSKLDSYKLNSKQDSYQQQQQSIYFSPQIQLHNHIGHLEQIFSPHYQHSQNNTPIHNNTQLTQNTIVQQEGFSNFLQQMPIFGMNSIGTMPNTQQVPIKQIPKSPSNLSKLDNFTSTPANVQNASLSTQNIPQQGLENYSLLAHLGRGNYGDVYLVQHIKNKKKYAMKLIDKEKLMVWQLKFGQIVKNMMRYAIAERNIMQKCNSPFIVKMYHSFQTSTHLVIIMDYCPSGDLYTYLLQKKRFNEDLAMKYLCEILLAVEELHFHDVIYRDMKPENIVLGEDGHVKLIDFGLSKENIGDGAAQSFCGSAVYLAPEIIGKKGHNKSVDWYQYGVLAYELLVGQPPFNQLNRKELYFHIQNKRVEYPSYLSAKAKSLISAVIQFYQNIMNSKIYISPKLLNKNPDERLGSGRADSKQIKDHPFFDQINWFDVQQKLLEIPVIQQTLPISYSKSELKLPKFTQKDNANQINIPHWYYLDEHEFS